MKSLSHRVLAIGCVLFLLIILAGFTHAASDTKISNLTDGGSGIQLTDQIPVARNGQDYRITVNDILGRGLPAIPKQTVVTGGTCSTSYNVDPTAGSLVTLTLSGACALDITNLAAGQTFSVKLTQSSTVAPTFSSKFKWAGGVTPTFSSSSTKYDVIGCTSLDGTTADCGARIDVR